VTSSQLSREHVIARFLITILSVKTSHTKYGYHSRASFGGWVTPHIQQEEREESKSCLTGKKIIRLSNENTK